MGIIRQVVVFFEIENKNIFDNLIENVNLCKYFLT